MPNWCDMVVEMTGDKETLEQIKAQGAEGEGNLFSFDNFHPTPDFENTSGINGKPLEETVAEWGKGREGNFDNWYDWRIGNWGTKWDLAQDEISVSDVNKLADGTYEFCVSGMTAWSPALELFTRISEQYPAVTITYRYIEEGMSFMGKAVIHNGIIDDDCREITSADLLKAGAVLDEEGCVDWDKTDEYDLMSVLK